MFRYYALTLCLCVVLFLLSFVLINQEDGDLPHKFVAISRKTYTQPVKKILVNERKVRSNEGPVRKPKSRFFVFSPQCKIPYVNPFDHSFMKYERVKFMPCTNESALISVIYDLSKRQYKLQLNFEVALTQFASYKNYGCTYAEITPGTSDADAFLNPPTYMKQDFYVPTHFLGVFVECHELASTSRILQSDAFYFVQYPKNRNEANDAKRAAKYPNVFLFGIDGTSRMNFHRFMPRTSKFVSQEGWYEMEGYNKVGDNTLPNLLAVLTGRTPKDWRSLCDVRERGCLDRLTYIWDHFRNAGYLTAYAEDLAPFSTFNYLKHGFDRQPVDYYLHHFLMVVEQVMDGIRYLGKRACVGRRHSYSYVLDFAKQLIERFVIENPKPLFGLFWTSSCTHDDFRGGQILDKPFVRYMEKFQEYGLFERSIVILFSDHGSRYGPLAQHYTGFLEERLPMLHIYIPPWYRKRYPGVARALQLNRNRLSSNYDLFEGLRHIIKQIRPGIDFNTQFPAHTIRSIFSVLPKNRSCFQAGILDHWCTCKPFVDVTNRDSFLNLAERTISRMNKFLHMLGLDTDCILITLQRVLKVNRQLHFDDLGNIVTAPNGLETFSVLFKTNPNDALFRAIVQSNENQSVVHTEIDMISRVNAYGNQSYCVKDAVAKKFCQCRKDIFIRSHQRDVKRERKV
ncbi:hypothetical protein KR032_004426, partial [Drosophila birchii]